MLYVSLYHYIMDGSKRGEIAPRGIRSQVQGVGQIGWVNTRPLICRAPYGMASRGQEEPFSRLALAVHCDESSLYLQKGFAHSCSDFGGKFQTGGPANSRITKFA